MGFLLPDWTNLLKSELKNFCGWSVAFFVHINQLKNELATIDKNKYPHEYNARLKIIESKESEISTIIGDFFNTKISEIKKILSQSNLNNSERGDLSSFYEEFTGVYNRYKKENILQYN